MNMKILFPIAALTILMATSAYASQSRRAVCVGGGQLGDVLTAFNITDEIVQVQQDQNWISLRTEPLQIYVKKSDADLPIQVEPQDLSGPFHLVSYEDHRGKLSCLGPIGESESDHTVAIHMLSEKIPALTFECIGTDEWTLSNEYSREPSDRQYVEFTPQEIAKLLIADGQIQKQVGSVAVPTAFLYLSYNLGASLAAASLAVRYPTSYFPNLIKPPDPKTIYIEFSTGRDLRTLMSPIELTYSKTPKGGGSLKCTKKTSRAGS